MNKDLVVLAAGMGSRYGGLKQIDPVGPSGELVIDYSIYDALRAGFDRVVFVIREDMEDAFRDGIGYAMEKRIDTRYAYQKLDDLPPPFTVPENRAKPWGTGHAVLAARHTVTRPFAVINADDFYGPTAFRLLADHLDRGAPDYTMVAYELARTVSEHGTVSRGLCRTDAGGLLIDIEEVTAIAKTPAGLRSGEDRPHADTTPTSMNCWGFFPNVFERLDDHFRRFLATHATTPKAEFYLPGSVSDMIANGEVRVKIQTTPDAWYGVTYREDKPTVMAGIRKMIEAGTYPAHLWG